MRYEAIHKAMRKAKHGDVKLKKKVPKSQVGELVSWWVGEWVSRWVSALVGGRVRGSVRE